jgi:N-acetylglucosaminyl-diphospho-decaprenol L-rhamnosyltransferase
VSEQQHLNSGADGRTDLTVVVVSYNTVFLLDQMFAALDAARGNLEVQTVVVDNASRDGSATYLRTKYPDVELIENSVNIGFGRANNQAMSKAKGRYILLLNTDAFVAPDTLSKTIEYMEADRRCGVLGVKLVGSDGSLQPSCRYFPTPWNVFLKSTGLMRLSPSTRLVDDMSWDHNSIRKCDWVPGCFYLMRREVIEQVGLFDPIYFLYYEEVDHCRAVRNAGWNVIFFPFTRVIHVGGESAQTVGALTDSGRQVSALQLESELLYFRKHFGFFGLLRGAWLLLLADILSCGKGVLSGLNVSKIHDGAMHMKLLLALLINTRFGRRPTR